VKIGIAVGIVIVILALVICLAPLKQVPYAIIVDYEDTETYYEDEPYEDTETYTETVPLDYEVVESDGHPEGFTTVVSVVVRNEDNIAGTFNVNFSVLYGCTFIEPGSIRLTGIPFLQEKELYLEPNEIGTAAYRVDNEYPANCAFKSWSYDVTSSTKEVEKETTVTRYRQVEKQRTVTKQRQETRYKKVTLLDYLLHY
jgi:hypothetical protein